MRRRRPLVFFPHLQELEHPLMNSSICLEIVYQETVSMNRRRSSESVEFVDSWFMKALDSRLAEQTGGDVTHVCLLELVVETVVLVDTHEQESLDDLVEVETHV